MKVVTIKIIFCLVLCGLITIKTATSSDVGLLLEEVEKTKYEDGYQAINLLDSLIFSSGFHSLKLSDQIDIYCENSQLTLKLFEAKPKLYSALADARKAYKLAVESNDIYRQTKSLDLISSCFFHLAKTISDAGFNDSLNKYHLKSFDTLKLISNKSDSLMGAAEVLNTRALSLITANDDSAIYLIKKANSIFRRIGLMEGVGRTYFNISNRFHWKGEEDSLSNDSALFYISKSIKIYAETENKYDLAGALKAKGNYFIYKYFWSKSLLDLDSAITIHRRAIKVFPNKCCESYFRIGESFHWKTGNKEIVKFDAEKFADSAYHYYRNTIKVAKNENDKKCLEAALENYLVLFDTIPTNEVIIKEVFDGLRNVSEDEKSELLEAQVELRDFRINFLQQENQRKQNQYFIGGAVLLAVLIGLGLLFYQRIRIGHLQQQLRSKLERLRAQVDPHFISNCLNAIELLINENKPKKAADYLIEFSRLCRGVLYSTTHQDVVLAQEIDYLKNYVSLEQLRIGDKLQYEFVVHPSVNPQVIIVPTLLIQPFIENAIWHGIQKKEEGGKVKVTFSQIHNENGAPMLYCRVQDNGIGREAAMIMEEDSMVEKGDSYGLSITNERIQILDRIKQARQKVTDLFDDALQPAGTLVEIWLPITHP